MKHAYTFLSCAALLSTTLAVAQSTGIDVLENNDVNALFHSNGLISLDQTGGWGPYFFVPKTLDNSGPSPLFAGGLWIGGLSPDNVLHFAGERFEQNGHDFFTGPLGTNASISLTTSAQYDRLWKIRRNDVQQQIAYFNCLNDPTCDTQADFPGYSVPYSFYTWPAHGDTSLGQAYNLADFYDYNGDGTYNPDDGDAPCVPGDQSLYTIYNDKLNVHTESGGQPIGLEIHMMPFVYYSGVQAVAQTVFIRYKIINRSSMEINNTYIGLFNDFDLGCGNDDYLQCDVGRNLIMVLNGDNNDQDCNGHVGYGVQPPAFGQVILQGPKMDMDGMDNTDTLTADGYNGSGFNDGVVDNERFGLGRFMGFSNSSGPTSDPNTAVEYYTYLTGKWKDNTLLKYGGTGYATGSSAVPARYLFPGNSDPLGVGTSGQVMPPWTEASAGNPPGDRRGVASMGPFTLEPGQEEVIVVAYVYARAGSGGPEASVAALQQRTDSIRAFAQTIPGLLGPGSPCDALPTAITSHAALAQSFRIFPNPTTDELNVILPEVRTNGTTTVLNAQGSVVMEQKTTGASTALNVSKLAAGVYLLRVLEDGKAYARTFVKE